ncbi:MAG TPA: GNAT family protein [Solirubrobacteraceae bacterium]|nr:GNAT family protein [Solirubrobacteraceae bacterium]
MLAHRLTDTAHLRLLEERDASELYALIDRNRTHLSRWMPWAAGQTEAGTLEFIRLTRRQLADNDGIQTAIVADGAIAGMVGLHSVAWGDASTSIGYWLAEPYQHRGLMTAAVRAYIELVFGAWGLNRLELGAAVENERSRAVARRLGFREEGIRREAETVGGHRHDLVVYGLLAADWRARPAAP